MPLLWQLKYKEQKTSTDIVINPQKIRIKIPLLNSAEQQSKLIADADNLYHNIPSFE